MRDVMFSAIREFYPDAPRTSFASTARKMARLNAQADAAVY